MISLLLFKLQYRSTFIRAYTYLEISIENTRLIFNWTTTYSPKSTKSALSPPDLPLSFATTPLSLEMQIIQFLLLLKLTQSIEFFLLFTLFAFISTAILTYHIDRLLYVNTHVFAPIIIDRSCWSSTTCELQVFSSVRLYRTASNRNKGAIEIKI